MIFVLSSGCPFNFGENMKAFISFLSLAILASQTLNAKSSNHSSGSSVSSSEVSSDSSHHSKRHITGLAKKIRSMMEKSVSQYKRENQKMRHYFTGKVKDLQKQVKTLKKEKRRTLAKAVENALGEDNKFTGAIEELQKTMKKFDELHKVTENRISKLDTTIFGAPEGTLGAAAGLWNLVEGLQIAFGQCTSTGTAWKADMTINGIVAKISSPSNLASGLFAVVTNSDATYGASSNRPTGTVPANGIEANPNLLSGLNILMSASTLATGSAALGLSSSNLGTELNKYNLVYDDRNYDGSTPKITLNEVSFTADGTNGGYTSSPAATLGSGNATPMSYFLGGIKDASGFTDLPDWNTFKTSAPLSFTYTNLLNAVYL